MSICIIGERGELMAGYVGGLAERQGIPVHWLNESELGTRWSFDYRAPGPEAGFIESDGERVPFSSITGAYVNLSPEPTAPEHLDRTGYVFEAFQVMRRASLRCLINALPGVVANRPCAGRSNNSKPYQMNALARAGLEVPGWIATNSVKLADRFRRAYSDDVIVKSCSGLRSEVRLWDESTASMLREGTTPVILQARVPGFDVRVHTIGGKSLATSIEANGIDYRFATGPKSYRAIDVPRSVDQLCHRFASQERMVIAGFDFRVTDDGRWYCLEMNPVPTFLPYEFETGQSICDALLRALTA